MRTKTKEQIRTNALVSLFGSGFLLFKRYYFTKQRPAVCFVLFSFLFLLSSFKHEFHSSLAEVHYNPASRSLEVSLRVFSDDLGTAVGKANNRTVKIDESTAHEALIRQYVTSHFALIDGKNARKPLTWVGKEIAVDVTWLYFEIPVSEDPNGMKLQNSMLFESFEDQVNIVNFVYKSQKKTYLYKSDQATQTLQF